MTHKMSVVGVLPVPLEQGEKWYVKVAHRTVRILQAVEHFVIRFIEVDPIYPWRQ